MEDFEMIERVKQVIAYSGLSVNAFASKIGSSQATINQQINGDRKISLETIYRISSAFELVSTDWLITGRGQMLRNESGPRISYSKGIPYYNVDFLGGFDIVLNDQTCTPEYLIDFKKYNDATCWCNVTGHSMEPEIYHGDIIALRAIEDTSFLPLGEVYAIVTTNGMRTIKRLGPSSNPENYTLIPSNKSPEYGAQELPKKMIMKIYQVLGCMKKL